MRFYADVINSEGSRVCGDYFYEFGRKTAVVNYMRRLAKQHGLQTFIIVCGGSWGGKKVPVEVQYKFAGKRRYIIKKNEAAETFCSKRGRD